MSNDMQDQIESMVAYGSVVTVRHVPTRQCSQIIIEIPEEFHAAATVMLFGKNAFVLAATDKVNSPYGVVPLSAMSEEAPAAPAPSPASAPAHSERTQPVSYRGSGGLRVTVDPSRWLGIECQNAAFMFWLNVGSAGEAAETVRAICGVSSRKDIAKDAKAMAKFMDQIYNPFRRHMQQAASARPAVRA